jgi:predicted translin family RNA/ssDNA-binding protein
MLKVLGIVTLILAQPAYAADTWDNVKSYTVEKKDEAVAYGRKLVRQSDREIKQLERKASKASGEAKAQFQSDVKELKAKRAEASKKLDEMGKASSSAWDEAKNGFADAYQDLQDSYHKALKKLK